MMAIQTVEKRQRDGQRKAKMATGPPPTSTDDPNKQNRRTSGLGPPASSGGDRYKRAPVKFTSSSAGTTTTSPTISQVKRSKKGNITESVPGYYINNRVASLRDINANERCCLGLLNALMKKHGHTYASDEQLAYYLGLKEEGLRPITRRLRKRGYIEDISKQYGQHHWVVCPALRDKPKPSDDGF
jgi:hypothetical protein